MKARRTIVFNAVAHHFNRAKPLSEQRNEILGASEYYRANMASLNGNTSVTHAEAGRIVPSIQLAALRLAGVSRNEALAMIAAD